MSDGSRTFQWDGASRLTHYAAGADSPRFTYDAFGRMLTRTQGNQAVSQGWNYGNGYPTNDDLQVILPGPKTSYNVHTPSGLLLYSIDGTTGARTFYHYDESGNTIFLTNTSSSVQTEYAYTPSGGVSALGQTSDNPFTYGAAAGVMQASGTGPLPLYFDGGGSCWDSGLSRDISEAGTFMHELGHNLGLDHGSDDHRGHWSADINQGNNTWAGNSPNFNPRSTFTHKYAVFGHFSTCDAVSAANGREDDPGPAHYLSIMNHRYQLGGGIPRGSGMSEAQGNDAIVALGSDPFDGDGLPDAWEENGYIDANCDGQSNGGGDDDAVYTVDRPYHLRPKRPQTMASWSKGGPQIGGPGNLHSKLDLRDLIIGGLQKCTGLKKTTEMVEWKDRDDKGVVKKVPGRTNYAPISIAPNDDEIYPDKHARVKMQFFWDREGQKDPSSSAWVRVGKPSGSAAPCMWCVK